jgi:hypothetical protein
VVSSSLELILPPCVFRVPVDQAASVPLRAALVEMRGEEGARAEWANLLGQIDLGAVDRQYFAVLPGVDDGPAIRGIGWLTQVSADHPAFDVFASRLEAAPLARRSLTRRVRTWDHEVSRGIVAVSLEMAPGRDGDLKLAEIAEVQVDVGPISLHVHLETTDLSLFEDVAGFMIDWFTHA